jgi:hypothetical protein
MKRFALQVLTCGLLMMPAAALSAADEKKPTKSSPASAKESSAKTKAPAKSEGETAKKSESGGRLPRFFASLVDDEQRESIYAVQEKYRSKIDSLREQLREIESEQLKEIESVLTAAQRKELETLRGGSTEKETPAKTEAAPKKKAA